MDTACSSDLTGTIWVSKYCDHLKHLGIKYTLRRIGAPVDFDFGGDNTGRTMGRFSLPAWPFGSHVELRFYLIKGNNPYLLSLSTVERLHIDILSTEGMLKTPQGKFPFNRSKAGHIVVPFLPSGDVARSLAAFPSGLRAFVGEARSECAVESPPASPGILVPCYAASEDLPGVFTLITRDPIFRSKSHRRRRDLYLELGRSVSSEAGTSISDDDLVLCASNDGREFLIEKLSQFCEKNLGFWPDHIVVGFKVLFLPLSPNTLKAGVLQVSRDNKLQWVSGVVVGQCQVDLSVGQSPEEFLIAILFEKFEITSIRCYKAVQIARNADLVGDWLSSRPIITYSIMSGDDEDRIVFAHPSARRPCLERFIFSLERAGCVIATMHEKSEKYVSYLIDTRNPDLPAERSQVTLAWRAHDASGPFLSIEGPPIPKEMITRMLTFFMQDMRLPFELRTLARSWLSAGKLSEIIEPIQWLTPDDLAEKLISETQSAFGRLQKVAKVEVQNASSIKCDAESGRSRTVVNEPNSEEISSVRAEPSLAASRFSAFSSDISQKVAIPSELEGSTYAEQLQKEFAKGRWLPRALDGKSEEEVQELLLKVHQQLGHCSEENLRRAIRTCGASKEHLKQVPAALRRCTCHKWKQKPKAPPVVALPRHTRFGEGVMMDLMWLNEGQGNHVLHVIDCRNRLSAAIRVSNKKPTTILYGFFKCWVPKAGCMPSVLYIDPGGELANSELEEVAAQWGISVEKSADKAHWQRGLIERHHQVLRESYHRARSSNRKLPDEVILIIAVDMAKNHLSNVRGMSPWQLTIGQQPVLPNILNADLPLLTRTEEDLRATEDISFLYAMQKAREGYIIAEMDGALRAAFTSRLRVSGYTEVSVGQKVYFWHFQHKNKPNYKSGEVVGQMRGKVLIHVGTRIVEVPPNWIMDPKTVGEFVPQSRDVQFALEDETEGVRVVFDVPEDVPIVDEDEGPPDHQRWQKSLSGPYNEQEVLDDTVPIQLQEPDGQAWQNDEPAQDPVDLVEIREKTQLPPIDQIEPLDAAEKAAEMDPVLAEGDISAEVPSAPSRVSVSDSKVQPRPSPVKQTQMESGKKYNLRSQDKTYNLRPKKDVQYKFFAQKAYMSNFRCLSDNDIMSMILFSDSESPVVYVETPRESNHDAYASDAMLKVDLLKYHLYNRDFDDDDIPAQAFVSKRQLLKQREIPYPVAMKDERFTWDKGAIWRELESWKENGVVEVVPIDKRKKLVSSRWVFTEKDEESGTDPIGWGKKAKARLVVKGFMDPEKGKVATDSPTMRREYLRILAWLCAQNGWEPGKYDIKTAFLNAKIPRDIQIKPPPEAKVPEGEAWRLVKAAYGLVDAPREWYLHLARALNELPLVQSRYDPCVWYFFEKDTQTKDSETKRRDRPLRKLSGVIGCHVDDLFVAGNDAFREQIIGPLEKTFQMGLMMKGDFIYCGIHVKHNPADGSISLDQHHYVAEIEDIDLPAARWKQSDDKCTPDEVTIFRGKLGELMWLSGQTRPDLAMVTSELSKKTSDLRIHHLAMAQAAVESARDKTYCLVYRKLVGSLEETALNVFFDASFGDIPQAGMVAFVGPRESSEGTCQVCLLDWRSHKQYRVVHSTFAAETLSGAEAMDTVRYLQLCITEAYGWTDRDQDLWPIRTSLITDCDSLWSNTRSLTTNVKEKALLRELAIFREALMQGVIEQFRWIPTTLQLADPLTKVMDADELIAALTTGEIRVKPNDKELASKKGTMKLSFIHELPLDMVKRGRSDKLEAFVSTIRSFGTLCSFAF